jgi:hypothetical protein
MEQTHPRFTVTENATGQAVAVVDAKDALEAQRRFEQVRKRIELLEGHAIGAYSATGHTELAVTVSWLKWGWFETQAAVETERLLSWTASAPKRPPSTSSKRRIPSICTA